MKYLFDASAIYTLIRLDLGEKLIGNCTLRIARYEIGSAILKEGVVHKNYTKSQQYEFLGIIYETLNSMKVFDIEEIGKNILDVAITFQLSFYDASYVYSSKRLGLALVTEDLKLTNKVKGYIKTMRAGEI